VLRAISGRLGYNLEYFGYTCVNGDDMKSPYRQKHVYGFSIITRCISVQISILSMCHRDSLHYNCLFYTQNSAPIPNYPGLWRR
jgi:hypothetical protein